ncbi:MAG: hypothetical protein ACXACB_07685, partial [Promethearchaeota archaeon]
MSKVLTLYSHPRDSPPAFKNKFIRALEVSQAFKNHNVCIFPVRNCFEECEDSQIQVFNMIVKIELPFQYIYPQLHYFLINIVRNIT